MSVHSRIKGAVILSVCSAPLLSGCGREMVSRGEFFDTAFGVYDDRVYAAREGQPYGYVSPRDDAAAQRAESKVIVVRDREGDPYVTIRDPDPDLRDDWNDNELTLRERSAFAADVHDELEELARELERVEARARIKGAAALAAFEPGARDFEMSLDVIETRMTELRNAREIGDWKIAATEVHSALADAREAVHEADEAVDRVPTYD